MFEIFWPTLEQKLNEVNIVKVGALPVPRTDRDILDEILQGVRTMTKPINVTNDFLLPWYFIKFSDEHLRNESRNINDFYSTDNSNYYSSFKHILNNHLFKKEFDKYIENRKDIPENSNEEKDKSDKIKNTKQ